MGSEVDPEHERELRVLDQSRLPGLLHHVESVVAGLGLYFVLIQQSSDNLERGEIINNDNIIGPALTSLLFILLLV